ncbi:heavy metal-associated isoprenylated plant protein 28-like [Neltuma alba]|uniref:heavy metal-associated isoprenylated plant protein 28-like n=1 Tax=Neltuma alba TaxID=207710 RepID=UPI0010A3B5D1|nr:heavy metal-associated isoprenylated plant protein 28-like [Prosopis alba]XP_028803865.1 heavy metal-associated isoprenylated plant protein 28-like [Prosopis alba]
MTIVEISVNIDCEGCERKIKKALQKLPGVDDVDTDMRMQKVTVMGWADQNKVLKAVRKTGKKAELWPYPYEPEYHGFVRHYCNNNNNYSYEYDNDDDDNGRRRRRRRSVSNYHSSSSSYNYYKHGYTNGDDFGYYQKPIGSIVVSEKAMSVFSDENPHACAIM